MSSQRLPISSLSIGTTTAQIRTRIGREWDSVNLKTGDVFGLNYQLLDNLGGEIHAEVKNRFLPLFYGKLKEGVVYDISNFTVSQASNSYLTVHNQIKLDFNSLTLCDEVEDPEEDIPMQKFSFVDYETIIKRTEVFKYLTDVIGILHHVGESVSQSTGNSSNTQKREIVLYLNCNTPITATLWGSKATLIDPSAMDDGNKTLILTSMTVKCYKGKQTLGSTTATKLFTNLDIIESSDLLKSFRKRRLPAFTAEDNQPAKHVEMIHGKSLSQILDPSELHESAENTYEIKAKITDIILSGGWEYLSCNVCKKGVGKSGPKNYCDKCQTQTEFPLHRFRLEYIIDDGTTAASIILFDKVAQFLLKHKAEVLFDMQQSEVGGEQKVSSILHQPIGNTEIFHATVDKFLIGSGQTKLIASKIVTRATETLQPTTPKLNSKVGPSKRGPQSKVSAKKKSRTDSE